MAEPSLKIKYTAGHRVEDNPQSVEHVTRLLDDPDNATEQAVKAKELVYADCEMPCVKNLCIVEGWRAGIKPTPSPTVARRDDE
jgi:hypothetical protein